MGYIGYGILQEILRFFSVPLCGRSGKTPFHSQPWKEGQNPPSSSTGIQLFKSLLHKPPDTLFHFIKLLVLSCQKPVKVLPPELKLIRPPKIRKHSPQRILFFSKEESGVWTKGLRNRRCASAACPLPPFLPGFHRPESVLPPQALIPA